MYRGSPVIFRRFHFPKEGLRNKKIRPQFLRRVGGPKGCRDPDSLGSHRVLTTPELSQYLEGRLGFWYTETSNSDNEPRRRDSVTAHTETGGSGTNVSVHEGF